MVRKYKSITARELFIAHSEIKKDLWGGGLIDQQQLDSQHILIEPSRQAGIDGVKADQFDAFFYYSSNVAITGIEVYAQDKGISIFRSSLS